MIFKILAIARFTLLEEVRNRILNATFLFGGILIYFGLVLTRLAAGFEDRFFRDVSFALSEFFGLAIILQSAYRIVQQDMRKGSGVEIFFVRPIGRREYLFGRFLGLAFVLFLGLSVLTAVIIGFMAGRGFDVPFLYAVVLFEMYLKLLVMLSIAFLMASITTSQTSYFVSSLLIYLSGHVTHLLRGLVDLPGQQTIVATLLVKPLIYLLPNFSLFGVLSSLDAILAGVVTFAWTSLAVALLYSVAYALLAWTLSAFLFSKREILPM